MPTLIDADILGHLLEKFLDPAINLSPNPVLDSEGAVKLPGLEDLPREEREPALELIWGERMGGPGESNTRTTTWAEKRLRDSAGRLFGRRCGC